MTQSTLEAPHPDPSGGSSLLKSLVRALAALIALYLFISSVGMIGSGLKLVAKDPAGDAFLKDHLFSAVSDPLTGLFIGLLVTSLVQSSSFTTSMTVGLVAGGELSLTAAIPIIMGANVGTSVTNLLVSMAHVRRRREFRRSLGGAIVHDFFNVLSVMVLLPLEAAFGIISRITAWASIQLGHTAWFESDPTKKIGGAKAFFSLPSSGLKWTVPKVFGTDDIASGVIIAILALVLLFVALAMLVKILRSMLHGRLSGAFSRTLFRNPGIAFAVGIIITASVQSSSVTTSLVVPLVGAGILKIRQIYPYTLGANIGTTCTAMLAALGTGNADAVACAFGHFLFNIYGTAIFWPLQFIPISLAKGFARIAARRRLVAVGFLVGLFFILPSVAILIVKLTRHLMAG